MIGSWYFYTWTRWVKNRRKFHARSGIHEILHGQDFNSTGTLWLLVQVGSDNKYCIGEGRYDLLYHMKNSNRGMSLLHYYINGPKYYLQCISTRYNSERTWWMLFEKSNLLCNNFFRIFLTSLLSLEWCTRSNNICYSI